MDARVAAAIGFIEAQLACHISISVLSRSVNLTNAQARPAFRLKGEEDPEAANVQQYARWGELCEVQKQSAAQLQERRPVWTHDPLISVD
jgi:hypothetical protein